MQVIRAAGFRASAGQTAAAERLRADHCADHVAVDVDIAVRKPRRDTSDSTVDARMNAERQPVAIAGDVVEKLIKLTGAPAHDMQHRAEDFFLEIAGAIE